MIIRYLTPATDIVDVKAPKEDREFSKMRSVVPAALLASLGVPANLFGPPKVEHLRKCGLPGCEKESARDYCCAEHCQEHRRLDRARRMGT